MRPGHRHAGRRGLETCPLSLEVKAPWGAPPGPRGTSGGTVTAATILMDGATCASVLPSVLPPCTHVCAHTHSAWRKSHYNTIQLFCIAFYFSDGFLSTWLPHVRGAFLQHHPPNRPMWREHIGGLKEHQHPKTRVEFSRLLSRTLCQIYINNIKKRRFPCQRAWRGSFYFVRSEGHKTYCFFY